MIFLGVLDIFSGAMLLATLKFALPMGLVIFCAAYLILKGFLFIRDIASVIDIVIGALLVATLFDVHLPKTPAIIFTVFLTIKGLMTCVMLR